MQHLQGPNDVPDDVPDDTEIIKYEKSIKQEYEDQPRVSPKTNLDFLIEEYASNPTFLQKCNELINTCSGMRKIRKDGNCFYRAFAFRLCELIIQNHGTPWHDFIISKAKYSSDIVSASGYDMDLLQDFYQVFETAFNLKRDDDDELLKMFNTEYISDTIVCYLRILTAAILKRDSFIYEGFIMDGTLQTFIASQVEPMHVESDQIHIVAICNALCVNIKIANLDSSAGGINYHDISPMDTLPIQDSPVINLLYRPGHYDVLYKKSSA